MYPHGHELFNKLATEMMELHSTKNRGYAGGGAPLGNFQRVSEIMKHYPNFHFLNASELESNPLPVLWMYLMKHIDNIMWNIQSPAKIKESVKDLAVYAMIMLCMIEDLERQ